MIQKITSCLHRTCKEEKKIWHCSYEELCTCLCDAVRMFSNSGKPYHHYHSSPHRYIFFPGLFFIIYSYFCSFMVVWGLEIGVLC